MVLEAVLPRGTPFLLFLIEEKYAELYRVKRIRLSRYVSAEKAFAKLSRAECTNAFDIHDFIKFLYSSREMHAVHFRGEYMIHPQVLFNYMRKKAYAKLDAFKEISSSARRKVVYH